MAQELNSLFGLDLPPGFHYRPEFIDARVEAGLMASIAATTFSAFEMRGVVARRRVAFFGRSYDAGGPAGSPPLPAFLLPLRARLAEWAGVPPEAFAMGLINEYPPGAPIGWHRDAPQYDIVAGVSLLSEARMKLRPYVSPSARAGSDAGRRQATHDILLPRRSAYVMTGAARNAYEHHVPPVHELRYSITFRTLR